MISNVNRAYKIIGFEGQHKLKKIVVLLLLSTILEMISVGMILPIIALLSDGDGEVIRVINEKLGVSVNKSEIVVGVCVCYLMLMILKSTFVSWVQKKQSNFVFDTQYEITVKLFKNYLSKSYEYYVTRPSAKVITLLTTEVGRLIDDVLLPLLAVLSDLLIVISLTVILMLYKPAIFTLVLLLSPAAYFLVKRIKNIVTDFGVQRQRSEYSKFVHLQHSIGSARDLKLYGLESYYNKLYSNESRKCSDVCATHHYLQQLPRVWLEVIIASGLAFIILYNTIVDVTGINVLPEIAFFAACAFKAMPSINRLVVSIQTINYSSPLVEEIERELNLCVAEGNVKNDATSSLAEIDKIVLNKVSFAYEEKLPILNNLSLTIRKGQSLAIVGKSGCGKSTLVNLIAGLFSPSDGEVTYYSDSSLISACNAQGVVTFVPQSVYLINDTLAKNVAFGIDSHEINTTKVEWALNKAGLSDYIKSSPDGVNTRVGEGGVSISGGQRQRVAIARALYRSPLILIMDEPTSALDSESSESIAKTISELKIDMVVIAVTHDRSFASKFDNVLDLGPELNT